MRTYVKIICIILSVLMIAVPLLSCKGVSGGGETGTGTGTAATTTEKAPDVTDAPSGTENTEGSGNGTDAPEIPDEPLPEFEDHLISKWDFEGDNALSDKASGGESKEAVTLSGSATVFGGILSVYGAYGSYASIDASAGSDVYDLKNKTVVLKARISNDLTEGPKNNISGLLSKESGYDVYFSNEENGRVSQFRYFTDGSRPYYISKSKTPLTEWRIYAVTVEYKEKTGGTEICFYKSTVEDPGSAADFELIYSVILTAKDSSFLTGADSIILGKRYDHTGESRGIRSDFAEIRVYDTVLNASELAEIGFDTSLNAAKKELSALIEYAKSYNIENRTADEIAEYLKAISNYEKALSSNTLYEVKSAVSAVENRISMMTPKYVTNQIGGLTLIPYNNSELDVPIATGLHAYPGFYDIDGDGDMDFVSMGISRSYGGYTGGVLMSFKNVSGAGASHFSKGEVLQSAPSRYSFSYLTDGTPVFVDSEGYFYTKLSYDGFSNGRVISGITRTYKLYDIDGDGKSDAVYASNNFLGEYHDGIPYDENGNSLQTAVSGLTWISNTGSEKKPVFSGSKNAVKNSKGEKFTVSDEWQYTYFRSFSMFDWDSDGDLDLIAGGWQNVFYYYENKGNKYEPIFDNEGILIETETGVLRLDVCRYNIINYEWSGDGMDDLFIGTESGTTIYLVFKGFNPQTGAPVFTDKGYMMTDAEYMWVNALSRPTACDFDGDGDTDFIVGDNCGLLWFYENLTGGENPSWAYPVKMRDENGNILVIKAGYNGSFQGTTECEWGYSVPVACDWDGDGDIDIIANSVTGRIVWFENIGTKTKGQLTQPKAVEVEWTNGSKYPSSIWFTPEGNELITQHRTTPYATDFNGDGLCDLLMLDHEGYLAFYERYKENGVLKLKEGERIFFLDGEPLRLNDGEFGRSGRIKFVIVDWDGDGLLDVIVGNRTAIFYKTVKTENGKYYLENKDEISSGNISGHNQGITVVDFNADGIPDLVFGSESGYFYYLENNRE